VADSAWAFTEFPNGFFRWLVGTAIHGGPVIRKRQEVTEANVSSESTGHDLECSIPPDRFVGATKEVSWRRSTPRRPKAGRRWKRNVEKLLQIDSQQRSYPPWTHLVSSGAASAKA
jgi:hypothetical protein